MINNICPPTGFKDLESFNLAYHGQNFPRNSLRRAGFCSPFHLPLSPVQPAAALAPWGPSSITPQQRR